MKKASGILIIIAGICFLLGCGDKPQKQDSKQGNRDETIKVHSTDANAHYDEGKVHREQDNEDKAIALWEKVVEINPDHPRARYNLGLAYKTQGDRDKAIVSWNKVIEIDPSRERAYNNLEHVGRSV